MAQACFDPRESVRCVPYSSRTLSPKKGRSPSRVQILATSIKLTEFLLSMWERMYEFEKDQDKGVFSFGKHDILRTHPATKQRIQDLQRWIPDALTVRKASMCSINDRLTVLDELRAFRDQLLAIKGGDWRGLGKRHLTMTQNSA
ncbi:hypothetical protein FRB90_011093 [Tulasnella sp. 427]|nr:hypothetical protein FRB90_011093 [Tulasnella sp. 427]